MYKARIIEAESGESLPLVGVYVSADVNTLTNFDGEFSIAAQPDDMVRLTCIGRRTLTFRASELPAVIRMPMNETTMTEVTITGIESLLARVGKQLAKDYKSKKKKEAQYFYRQTSLMAQKQDIVEAFVGASSAANLRNLYFISGRHGLLSRQHWEQSALRNMNLHHILELGPLPFDVSFWSQLVTPLPRPEDTMIWSIDGDEDGKPFHIKPSAVSGISYLQKIYHITAEEMIDDDGTRLTVVHLALRDGVTLKQPVMTGTLYLDRQRLRVLAFDGHVENMLLQLRRSELQSPINVPVAMKFHIDYRYDHKYAEVADLSMITNWDITGSSADEQSLLAQLNTFQTRTLLFNVDTQKRMKRAGKKAIKARENMLSAIDEAGYDSTFWANNDVVKRTAEEEAIANGTLDREQALRDSLNAYLEDLSPVARLADRLKRFGKSVPQEKVYVHMDNTGYFLGDTIWFAAYTRKTNTDTPSRISRVLYAELWNHDGFLVERKLIEMKDGRGHGFFALPDTLYSGYFELRAYTRWQLNWGQTEHLHNWATEYRFFNKAMAKDFFRDYEKLYSRVFPVYDKPKEEGDFYKDMTFRPLRRYFKTDPKEPELRLSLFPEGGNLVAGLPCRVAFEAATEEGEVREGTLRLMMGKQVIATVHTENRGRGTFAFTPEEGQTYEAVFYDDERPTDEEVKARSRSEAKALVSKQKAKEARQEIKAAKTEGVALQVTRDSLNGQWVLDIAARGIATTQPLGITVANEGKLAFFKEINLADSTSACARLILSQETDQGNELVPGVNQVTVFDSIGHIYADRLFFVTRPELTQPSLQFTGIKDQYAPFEAIDFGVTAADILPDMTISLAVRDAVHTDNTFDTGNILTEMLLSSEIKGFVPQPEYFFERDDEEHRRALDLLMLTQGWRRYNWQDMAIPGLWDLTHPAEHTQMVSGTVNRYSTLELEAMLGLLDFNTIEDMRNEFNQFGEEGLMNYHTGHRHIGTQDYIPLEYNALNDPYGYGTRRSSPFTESTPLNSNAFTGPTVRTLLGSYRDMEPIYQSRSRIGAIADTRHGIYSQEGLGWANTDYNVLRFKTDKQYRQLQRDRLNKAARQYLEEGNLKRDVTIHAEFINPFNANNILVGESMTTNGRFLIDMPRFTGECYFHLAAADTTKWHSDRKPKKAGKAKNVWIQPENSDAYDRMFPQGSFPGSGRMPELPDFYVRINFPYPRWIKPYTYYQVHDAPLRESPYLSPKLTTDGVHLLEQVTIRTRRGGLRNLDYSKPAYVIDAYDAANMAIDAGLAQFAFASSSVASDIVTVLMGDMGTSRHFGYDRSIDQHGPGYLWPPGEYQRNCMLTYFDKFYIYTDYSPRREGDERFEQSNQPSVRVDMRRLPDEGQRQLFVNRHLVLPGFAYQEDFYHPDYKRNPPTEGQKDYRRTLYWNPELKLDKRGQTRVRLFNNSQYTSLLIEAEGQTENGGLLWGRE